MNRCLKDQTLLLLLYEGEGTAGERRHLEECTDCAKRSERLKGDLGAICRVLRQDPPPSLSRHRSRSVALRWLPAAVAITLALVLVWERVHRPPAPPALSEEILSVMEEFPIELVQQNPLAAEELWARVADAYERGTALEADWPCDWYDLPVRGEAESGDAGSADFPAAAPVCMDLNQS